MHTAKNWRFQVRRGQTVINKHRSLAKLSPNRGKNVRGSSNQPELSFKRLITGCRFRLLAGETRVFGQTSRHFYPAEGRLHRAHLLERREKFISYLGAHISRVVSLAIDSNSSTARLSIKKKKKKKKKKEIPGSMGCVTRRGILFGEYEALFGNYRRFDVFGEYRASRFGYCGWVVVNY